MSKKLAIKGHPTRGNEVIELFKMMGGWECGYCGCGTGFYYYISQFGNIEASCKPSEFDTYIVYTLEEFLEKYPFKVGDFVRIPEYESEVRILKMKWCPISKHIEFLVCPNDEDEWFTVDELLEDNDNPNETTDCKKCGLHFGSVKCFDKDCPYNTPKNKDNVSTISKYKTIGQGTYAIKIADGYKFDSVDENGNIIVKSIKPKYPATYGECWKVRFEVDGETILEEFHHVSGYYSESLGALQKLLCCRDAYWKIVGEEMGLGKPWEPKYEALMDNTFFTIQTFNGKIDKSATSHRNSILAFPTIEMRDVFFDNFKGLIEQCKELL